MCRGVHYLRGSCASLLCALALLRLLLWLDFLSGLLFLKHNLIIRVLVLHSRMICFSASLFHVLRSSFLYVLLLCFSIPCFLSGTPECHLLTSEAFNEIILKFLSAESPSILVPLTPSAFFTVTTDSPLTFLFFLTPLIELPGFYKAVK